MGSSEGVLRTGRKQLETSGVQLSEGLTSLGTKLGAAETPQTNREHYGIGGLKGTLPLVPHFAKKRYFVGLPVWIFLPVQPVVCFACQLRLQFSKKLKKAPIKEAKKESTEEAQEEACNLQRS